MFSKKFYSLASLILLISILSSCALNRKIVDLFTESRPNFLFISIDDLNHWVSFLENYPGVKTPNLQRLADESLVFKRAYANSTHCNPSRISVLTGMKPSSTGIYANQYDSLKFLENTKTVMEVLADNNYKIWGAGKVFHGSKNKKQVWHRYLKFSKVEVPKKDFPLSQVDFKVKHFDWGPIKKNSQKMSDYLLASWGSRILKKQHKENFFLAMGFYRPHQPWYTPKKYFDLYPLEDIKLPEVLENDLDDVPEYAIENFINKTSYHKKILEKQKWQEAIQAYLASITFIDEQLGRLLDALETGPNNDNTIIVLWGDHGMHLGEKETWNKYTLWHQAVHVPFLISTPETRQHGSITTNAVVNLIDIFPTIMDFAKIDYVEKLEGRSLVPLFNNPADPSWDDSFAITTTTRDNHAIRTKDWTYIKYADDSEELYRADDYHEYINLANRVEYQEIKSSLKSKLPANPVDEIYKEIGKKSDDD